jgi:hypothetical protein
MLLFICLTLSGSCSKLTTGDGKPTKDDLDAKYRSSWESYRNAANTAVKESYLSVEEKEMFYYLNLARINPPLFAETYAAGYDGDNGFIKGYAWDERKQSLLEELKAMKPLSLILPDTTMHELASCFAYEGGRRGIVGHDRGETGCTEGYNAECCKYGGAQNGLSIIMSLLIDAGENNAALGHRRICLEDENYGMGVAIRPHTQYEFNAVLDFIIR